MNFKVDLEKVEVLFKLSLVGGSDKIRVSVVDKNNLNFYELDVVINGVNSL